MWLKAFLFHGQQKRQGVSSRLAHVGMHARLCFHRLEMGSQQIRPGRERFPCRISGMRE